MTKGYNNTIADTFNLPHLDDVISIEEPVMEEKFDNSSSMQMINNLEEHLKTFEGHDHAKAMDVIYKETLDHSRSLMDLGFNVDERSRRGIFEVATAMYKNALDAKNSKRDFQLKLMKLIIDQKKLDGTKSADGPSDIQGEVVAVEDRNELIRRIRDEINKDKS